MKTNHLSDQELIAKYQAGNENALALLIQRHKRRIFSTIYLIVKDKCIAEDIFQETFIKVIQTIRSEKYAEEGKILPWAIRIARNMAIDHFRKAQRSPTIINSEGNDVFQFITIAEENREEQMQRVQTRNTLRKLIAELPEEQREVLILRHYGDLSFKEIAEQTNVSINTALGRMRYALQNLRRMILEKELAL